MGAVALWAVALVVLAAGIAGVNSVRFRRRVRREAHAMCVAAQAARLPALARIEERRDLPEPVRHWLAVALASRHQPVRSVRMRHAGWFTTKLGAPPQPIDGEQWMVADPPGLVWWGRIRMFPGVWVEARDRVIGGIGNMHVKLESTATLADARGPEIDQSALLRLLGELVLLPSAYLDRRYVEWEALDDRRALARLTLHGKQVAGVFELGPAGMPVAFRCERYRDTKNGPVLTPFVGRMSDWRRVEGILVPFSMTASWVIDGREVAYGRWRVQSVEVEPPEYHVVVPEPPGLPTLLPVR